jgi:hypothetical protein
LPAAGMPVCAGRCNRIGNRGTPSAIHPYCDGCERAADCASHFPMGNIYGLDTVNGF